MAPEVHGLNEEQVHEFTEHYDLFKNESGSIASNNLGTLVRSFGMNPTMADLEKYITKADPKGTGFITHVAYLNLMGSLCIDDKEDTEDQLRESFRIFDKNGDGFLSSSELQYAMTSLGERLSSEELHGLMSEADLDGDGQLNYEEFINVMLSR